eukprot:GHVU01154375.1.p3 GENE.GHVU01154375.1~~GHVU01154375.1.p3  ORF type:complete len:121 (+),score=8.94 GHVU01154375.1:685-1047(+)
MYSLSPEINRYQFIVVIFSARSRAMTNTPIWPSWRVLPENATQSPRGTVSVISNMQHSFSMSHRRMQPSQPADKIRLPSLGWNFKETTRFECSAEESSATNAFTIISFSHAFFLNLEALL